MYKFHKLLLISLLFLLLAAEANSQGCSDAGFCTMGAMKPAQAYKNRLHVQLRSVELSQYVGLTRFKDIIMAYQVDANFSLGDRSTFQVKLPYQMTYGVLANTQGVGDISLSFTHQLVYREHYQLNGTLGAKIPTHDGNRTTDSGLPLPMYYQSSLGTYDLVAGLSFTTRNWMLAFGYQHPFTEIKNDFAWGPWNAQREAGNLAADITQATIEQYPSSRQLYRGNDLMLRIERNFRFAKFSISTGLLPIYRVGKDERTVPATGERATVDGSDGLALTYLLGGSYHLTPRSSINIMNGFRLIKRKFNPDGLSREFVNTIGYQYRF